MRFCPELSWTIFFTLAHETHEDGRRTYRPKRCDYNNKDEDNSPNILSNKNSFRFDFFSRKNNNEWDTKQFL